MVTATAEHTYVIYNTKQAEEMSILMDPVLVSTLTELQAFVGYF